MGTEAPFSDQEYFDRYSRAQALMARDGLDALVVSEKNNYWYFSGLISYQLDHIQRPQICILPKSGKPLLLVYGDYIDQDGQIGSPDDFFTPDEVTVTTLGLGVAASYRHNEALTAAIAIDYNANDFKGENEGGRYSSERREDRPFYPQPIGAHELRQRHLLGAMRAADTIRDWPADHHRRPGFDGRRRGG